MVVPAAVTTTQELRATGPLGYMPLPRRREALQNYGSPRCGALLCRLQRVRVLVPDAHSTIMTNAPPVTSINKIVLCPPPAEITDVPTIIRILTQSAWSVTRIISWTHGQALKSVVHILHVSIPRAARHRVRRVRKHGTGAPSLQPETAAGVKQKASCNSV